MAMRKAPKKGENRSARRGGSTFLGILIGLVLGLVIALGVAWYINKLPNPFKEKSQPYKAETPASKALPPITPTSKGTEPQPSAAEKSGLRAPETPTKGEAAADKAATEKKSTLVPKEAFFLQTGSFQDVAEADNLKARLALLGLEAMIQTRTLPEKGVWHRVRVGPYEDVEELNRVRSVLKQNNIDTALVKVREADK